MSQKSSLPQAAKSVSQVLMSDTLTQSGGTDKAKAEAAEALRMVLSFVRKLRTR
jgi:hypothetical protein